MKSRGKSDAPKQVAPLLGSGIQLTVTVLVFGGIGWWLDGQFDTKPWLLLTGTIFGIVGGMISFIRTALNAGVSQKKEQVTRTEDYRARNDEHVA